MLMFRDNNPKLTVKGQDFQEESKDCSNVFLEQPNSLMGKLFGQKTYNFRMEVDLETTPIFYKERNFNINVKLVNQGGKVVRNCTYEFI